MTYPDDFRASAPKPDGERTLEEGVDLIAAYLYCGPDEIARLREELAELRRTAADLARLEAAIPDTTQVGCGRRPTMPDAPTTDAVLRRFVRRLAILLLTLLAILIAMALLYTLTYWVLYGHWEGWR